MRYTLLCCSDTHGQRPPELDDSTATAWLHAGDLYDEPAIVQGDEPPLPGDPLAEMFLSWVRSRKAPIYAVHGNHDVADPYDWLSSVRCIDASVARLGDDLLVVGVGWHGERYYECPLEPELLTVCNQARRQIRRLARTNDRFVLLTHYPPLVPGLFPRKPGAIVDLGSQAVADLVKELRPILIVQGHEHSWFGITQTIDFGTRSCLVINPGVEGLCVSVDTDRNLAELL